MAGARAARTGTLVGRRSECEALERLVADVLAGRSRVLVLRGQPGVGKTALLDHFSRLVEGWRVVTAGGVESELELPYSGLHQMCAPLLGHLGTLPTPQQDALATVFGLRLGPPPDRFLVGLATLSLVAEAAEREPLACLVEDAQWIDRSSAAVLGFVARRLLAERVALVSAARTPSGDEVLAGMPELVLGGLAAADARRLLLGSVHGPIDATVADRLVAESHGNPLALLELPRTWTAADLAGGFGLPSAQPVAGRIEQSYGRRLARLPADSRLLALTAAAEPLGDPLLLGRAAELLGVEMAAAAPVADAGLLQVRGRVEFAHPLVRSAAYGLATAGSRQRVHRALAEATDAERDPDRRAWHRARATAEPDGEVAAELERSAGRARARGGIAAAAAFLARATDLTPDPLLRVRRALDAALANVQAGAFDAAGALLEVAAAGPLDELGQVRVDMVRAQMAFASARGNEATRLLVGAARSLQPLDPRSARATYLDAFSAAQFAGRLGGGVGVAEVARAVRDAPRPPEDELTPGDLVLEAFVALTERHPSAVAVGRRAIERLRTEVLSTGDRLRWLWQGCVLALELWDDETAYVLSERHLRLARAAGELTELPLALGSRTPILVFCGEMSEAAALVEEARSVHEAAGITEAPYGALVTAAWQGRVAEATALTAAAVREASARGEGVGVAISEYARAVLCIGHGRYEEALTAARGACADPQEMVAHNWGLPELVEAAVRTGRTRLAVAALDELAGRARAAGTGWALGMEARSRALLQDGESAEQWFGQAVEHLGRARVRGELGRAHLLFGEWLRRADRPLEARSELTRAYEMFVAMGLEGFAARARRELAATGAVVRARTQQPRDELTPQEAHIARLARSGMSNPEIGALLFLSARTVEWHLRKVFAKLGISSRRELRRVLPEHDEVAAAAALL